MGGLGHGAPNWIEQMGLKPESSMGLLREVTEAVRQLLAGEKVGRHGDYFEYNDISLDHPPATEVPLYYGVQGPASMRLSGELADGTLLGWFSSPGSVAWARALIDEGRDRGSRQDPHRVAVLCLLSMSTDDPDGAGRNLARWGAGMLAGVSGAPSQRSTQEGDELRSAVATHGKEGLGDALPLSLLRKFVATGTPDDCAATVTRLLEAGADTVVLVPNPAGYRGTADMVTQMELGQALLDGG